MSVPPPLLLLLLLALRQLSVPFGGSLTTDLLTIPHSRLGVHGRLILRPGASAKDHVKTCDERKFNVRGKNWGFVVYNCNGNVYVMTLWLTNENLTVHALKNF